MGIIRTSDGGVVAQPVSRMPAFARISSLFIGVSLLRRQDADEQSDDRAYWSCNEKADRTEHETRQTPHNRPS